MDINEILNLKHTLRFKDGKFRILMISDLHGGIGMSKQTAAAVKAMVDFNKPDLVLIGGDTSGCGDVHAETPDELFETLSELTAPMEDAEIPWAHVFGNHDDNFGLTNAEQEPVYESFPYCVSKWGPKDIYGVGNYVLPVLASGSDEVVFNVFGLDSHRSMKQFCKHCDLPEDTQFVLDQHFCNARDYDCVRFEQIMWYWNTSKLIEQHCGKRIPALMYMHMPLPEHCLVVRNRNECDYEGRQGENVACTELNSGIFSACVERGDVKAVFCGHEHVNNFSGSYCGIMLGYDGGLDYDCYQDDEMRSARVFDIDEACPDKISTHAVYLRDIIGDAGNKIEKPNEH